MAVVWPPRRATLRNINIACGVSDLTEYISDLNTAGATGIHACVYSASVIAECRHGIVA